MSILINGMEMPKNCNECPLHFYEGQGICSCRALPAIDDGEILKPWKRKRKDCPLISAADVRPVVRGHWIGTKEAEDMGDIMKEFTCSVCGCCEWDCTESESFNFCPNCGSRMEEN